MSHNTLQIISAGIALHFAVVASVWDLQTRRIPNRLLLLAIPIACISQLATSGWKGLGSGMIAAAIAMLIMSIGFLLGGVGAGDVKLMGAMGLFAGGSSILLLLTSTAVAGGVFALAALARMAYAHGALCRSKDGPQRGMTARSTTLPYAVPIACGVLTVFCHTLRSIA